MIGKLFLILLFVVCVLVMIFIFALVLARIGREQISKTANDVFTREDKEE